MREAQMREELKHRVGELGRALTTLERQPLGPIVLVVLLLLDLFVLVSIFIGLEDHTNQWVDPQEYIPELCQEIVIEGGWNRTNRLSKLAKRVVEHNNRSEFPDTSEREIERHPICIPLVRGIELIWDNQPLSAQLSHYLQIRAEITRLNLELERSRRAAEASGDKRGGLLGRSTLKSSGLIEERLQLEEQLVISLTRQPEIAALFTEAGSLSTSQKERLIDDLRRVNFWYPVQRLGMELLFLAPLLLIFIFWNSRSIARQRPYQGLVSSHLLVVLFIPILVKVVEWVYEIIPKRVLQQLIDFLESIHLVAIWHYLLMAIGVGVALGSIYLLQKRFLSRERKAARRISHGQCQACGVRLPPNSHFCPICGSDQFRQCRHCERETFIESPYCRVCGRREDELV